MSPLTLVHFSLGAALAIAAWAVAVREREHRPLALFATYASVSDVVGAVLKSLRAGAARPYSGLARVDFHAEQFLTLGWYALLLGVTLHYFVGRFRWIAGVIWLGAFAVCLDYPTVRGSSLAVVYRVTTALCVGGMWVAIVRGTLARGDRTARLAHLVIMALAATETAAALALLSTDYFSQWPFVDVSTISLFAFATLAHLWWLAKRRRTMYGLP